MERSSYSSRNKQVEVAVQSSIAIDQFPEIKSDFLWAGSLGPAPGNSVATFELHFDYIVFGLFLDRGSAIRPALGAPEAESVNNHVS